MSVLNEFLTLASDPRSTWWDFHGFFVREYKKCRVVAYDVKHGIREGTLPRSRFSLVMATLSRLTDPTVYTARISGALAACKNIVSKILLQDRNTVGYQKAAFQDWCAIMNSLTDPESHFPHVVPETIQLYLQATGTSFWKMTCYCAGDIEKLKTIAGYAGCPAAGNILWPSLATGLRRWMDDVFEREDQEGLADMAKHMTVHHKLHAGERQTVTKIIVANLTPARAALMLEAGIAQATGVHIHRMVECLEILKEASGKPLSPSRAGPAPDYLSGVDPHQVGKFFNRIVDMARTKNRTDQADVLLLALKLMCLCEGRTGRISRVVIGEAADILDQLTQSGILLEPGFDRVYQHLARSDRGLVPEQLRIMKILERSSHSGNVKVMEAVRKKVP
ncbi:MAG: hypothetical protein M3O22_02085 [Pseudomonadota bacterium]|nr:hypothetical protein [Pseudomonadota bacterium]